MCFYLRRGEEPICLVSFFFFFFFNATATTEIYTLSLHDALPIRYRDDERCHARRRYRTHAGFSARAQAPDRKSTRLNSSHTVISYAVFCLKKKNQDICENVQEDDPVDAVPAARLPSLTWCFFLRY